MEPFESCRSPRHLPRVCRVRANARLSALYPHVASPRPLPHRLPGLPHPSRPPRCPAISRCTRQPTLPMLCPHPPQLLATLKCSH
eukprot:12884182-Alexandrium_andersonii.AAC.1